MLTSKQIFHLSLLTILAGVGVAVFTTQTEAGIALAVAGSGAIAGKAYTARRKK